MAAISSFGRIKVDVIQLLGSHRQITSNDVSSLIQNENREILDNYDWSARKAEGVINTFSTVTAGTVTVTLNSAKVSGVSTVFTSDYVGRHIRMGSEEHFHEISSVTSAARLDLKTIWPTNTSSAQSYTIFQNRFALASDCEEIISMARDRRLIEKPRTWLDSVDPDRTETANYPDVWSYRELNSSNTLQVELWPVPTAKKAIRYEYLKSGDLASNADKPLYQPNVVKWKSGVAGSFMMYAKTGDPVWKDLAIAYQGLYKQALQRAKEEDQQKFSTRMQQRSRDADVTRSDDWATSHDGRGV